MQGSPDGQLHTGVVPRAFALARDLGYCFTMAQKPISEVTVIGSGVMGSGIAAHLADAGIQALLLDIVPRTHGRRPQCVRQDRRRGLKAPQDQAGRVLHAARRRPHRRRQPRGRPRGGSRRQCDLIIEASSKNLAVKTPAVRAPRRSSREHASSRRTPRACPSRTDGRGPQRRLQAALPGHALLQPGPLHEAARDRTGADTAPETLARVEDLCGRLLGKGIVHGKDTPNFVANRIGTFAHDARSSRWPSKDGYTVEEVDAIFGAPIGRPKSGGLPHRRRRRSRHLIHVAQQLLRSATADERREDFKVPARARADGREEDARRQDRRRLLQEDARRHRHARLQDDGVPPAGRRPRFASLGAADGSRRRRRAHPHAARRRRPRRRPGAPRDSTRRWPTRRNRDRRDRRRRRRHRSRACAGASAGTSARSRPGTPSACRRAVAKMEAARHHGAGVGRGDSAQGAAARLLPAEAPGNWDSSAARAASRRCRPTPRELPLDVVRAKGGRRRAQQRRNAARHRRRRRLPRVPHQDERHRRRHRRR